MDDRVEIFDYIEKQSSRTAVEVDDEFVKFTNLLSESPYLGRAGRRKGTRELILGSTGFIAYYLVQGNAVEILHVYRAKRRPPGRMKL